MQVFRRTVNVSSVLFQVTAYELPPSDTSLDRAPTLKFVAYDPKEHTQVGTQINYGEGDDRWVFVWQCWFSVDGLWSHMLHIMPYVSGTSVFFSNLSWLVSYFLFVCVFVCFFIVFPRILSTSSCLC